MVERITPAQLRKLHAVARERGFDHAAIRVLAGVPSLRRMTKEDARRLIDRLERGDRPQG